MENWKKNKIERDKIWRENNKDIIKSFNEKHKKIRKEKIINERKKNINYDKYTWYKIPNFNNELEININGDIIETNGYKLKKIYKDTNGYLQIHYKNKTYLHHRLIAITFIENPDNKSDVNHIDGDRSNNKISNLSWTTHSENIKYSFTNLNRKSNLINWNKKIQKKL